MKKILWLASWYPNERSPFSGDFIQRQAEAVALFQPLNVIFVGKGPGVNVPNSKLVVHDKTKGLKEYIAYYSSNGGLFSKLYSLILYFKKNLDIIDQLRHNNELPDLVHVQVSMKAGLIALYLRWKYHIPYVLTEHWTGYYPLSTGNLFRKNFLERYFTKRIIKNADRFLPVSEALGNQINQYWVRVPFQKITNVVNTSLFFRNKKHEIHTFRFIHISTLLYPKNPEGIIRSFDRLLQSGIDAELVLVGPVNALLKRLIEDIGTTNGKIHLTGEISYPDVGVEIRKADALVLFSYVENMPCVVLEALCTGIPVIASRVGGISEVVHAGNGFLVEAGNEEQLLRAMQEIILNYNFYDLNNISQTAVTQYSYESIGKQFITVYDDVLNKK